MMKGAAAFSFLLVLILSAPGRAETCDAGHGCRITCADGCSAIYNLDTHQCSKACGKAVSATAMKKRGGVNATFRDMPAADVENLLTGGK